jgi:hypothetical protein
LDVVEMSECGCPEGELDKSGREIEKKRRRIIIVTSVSRFSPRGKRRRTKKEERLNRRYERSYKKDGGGDRTWKNVRSKGKSVPKRGAVISLSALI